MTEQSIANKDPNIKLHRSVDTLWNFMSMGHKVTPSDCIFVLCSNDTRVAEYAAELYHQQIAPYIVFLAVWDALPKEALSAQKQKHSLLSHEIVACLTLTLS